MCHFFPILFYFFQIIFIFFKLFLFLPNYVYFCQIIFSSAKLFNIYIYLISPYNSPDFCQNDFIFAKKSAWFLPKRI